MQGSKHEYSSVYVSVPNPIADDIISWSTINLNDNVIYVSQNNPYYGREDEIHITALYGIHTTKIDLVKEIMQDQEPLQIELGKIQIFTSPFKFDVVVVEVISHDLETLHKKLCNNLKFTNKYPQYYPHVTVAYVKKGKGWKHHDLSIWDGLRFSCDYAIFSSSDGFKERIDF